MGVYLYTKHQLPLNDTNSFCNVIQPFAEVSIDLFSAFFIPFLYNGVYTPKSNRCLPHPSSPTLIFSALNLSFVSHTHIYNVINRKLEMEIIYSIVQKWTIWGQNKSMETTFALLCATIYKSFYNCQVNFYFLTHYLVSFNLKT